MHFIFRKNMKIFVFIHIYCKSQISENIIHISVINQLSNIDLIKIIQKVGDMFPRGAPPPPPATPMDSKLLIIKQPTKKKLFTERPPRRLTFGSFYIKQNTDSSNNLNQNISNVLMTRLQIICSSSFLIFNNEEDEIIKKRLIYIFSMLYLINILFLLILFLLLLIISSVKSSKN